MLAQKILKVMFARLVKIDFPGIKFTQKLIKIVRLAK